MERSSGILLPISSLPSPYGIGTFGRAAYDFVDFLHAAGQHCWQILPLGPTSYGDSPYQSFSTYAGNPYYVDLDLLIEDGLLTKEEVTSRNWGDDPRNVDYALLYRNRFDVLELAKQRGWRRDEKEVADFTKENSGWLPDYTLYMALKRKYDMKSWIEWPEDVRRREPRALNRCREELREDVELFTYIQYLFFRQWRALREYIAKADIRIIGDLPIYVAMDSADVWSEPDKFQLDENGYPTAVAGVPPDYFSEDGQLWGNPLYNYDAMERVDTPGRRRRKTLRHYSYRPFPRLCQLLDHPLRLKDSQGGRMEEGAGHEAGGRAHQLVPFSGIYRGRFGNCYSGSTDSAERFKIAGHEGTGIRFRLQRSQFLPAPRLYGKLCVLHGYSRQCASCHVAGR